MKLYTEEQVRQAMDFVRGYHRMSDTQFIETLTPIELPSDAEIDTFINAPRDYKMCPNEYREGIEEGAKWMRDKIQGGNK